MRVNCFYSGQGAKPQGCYWNMLTESSSWQRYHYNLSECCRSAGDCCGIKQHWYMSRAAGCKVDICQEQLVEKLISVKSSWLQSWYVSRAAVCKVDICQEQLVAKLIYVKSSWLQNWYISRAAALQTLVFVWFGEWANILWLTETFALFIAFPMQLEKVYVISF